MTPNFAAFLAMLSHSEGTDRAASPYRCCYKFIHVIGDLRYHPAEHRPPAGLQEWKGESLKDLDKLNPKYDNEVSTAAGRYQIILRTWLDCKEQLRLNDFTAASQNDAAILLVRRCGAFDDVNAGAIASAIAKCRNEWASLPGGTSNQPERTLAYLTDRFTAAGGVLAAAAA